VAAGPPRLEVEGLSRAFGARTALHEVSFTLDPGGLLMVLGPNGAGKTTLVRVLARLVRPDRGRVLLDGEDWLAAPPRRQIDVGLATHATFLYDALTALENLVFHGALYGLADPAGTAREALAAVGLGRAADRLVGTLSRGEAQRVAIARALLHGPRLLLLDEPFAGLDPEAATSLGALLGAVHGGPTVVVTTHDLARMPPIATRCLVLIDGAVAEEASVCGGTDGLEEAYDRALARSGTGRG
jgi:heme ABC exporter ATP-binding subunit CcmA